MKNQTYTPNDFKDIGPIPDKGIQAMGEVAKDGKLFRYSDTDPEASPVYLLEQWFVAYTGQKYALAANSCTSTIELALTAFGKRGDNVLIPAFTFGAVPSAVINADMTPVLVECDRTFKIDLDDLRRKAPGCEILLLSYMRSRIPNMDTIMEICREHNLTLIEDCAHGMGGTWKGQPVGTFGSAACFSFQDYKILPGGDGGMVTTNGLEAYAQMVLRHGAYEELWKKNLPNATVEEIGVFQKLANKIPFHNWRMPNMTAAALLPQLPLLYARTAVYRENYLELVERLRGCDLIEVPPEDPNEDRVLDSIQFRLPGFDPAEMQLFVELVKKRAIPIAGLGEPGNARAAWNWLYLPEDVRGNLPNTKKYLSNACDLRLVLTLTKDMLEYIAAAFIESAEVAERQIA